MPAENVLQYVIKKEHLANFFNYTPTPGESWYILGEGNPTQVVYVVSSKAVNKSFWTEMQKKVWVVTFDQVRNFFASQNVNLPTTAIMWIKPITVAGVQENVIVVTDSDEVIKKI